MRRIVTRALPDGRVCIVHPFHICIKGLDTAVLCRDDEDYDAMVKVICLSAWRRNVIIIIYAVASNHCHVAVLAKAQSDAKACAIEIKKMYSMWFSRKYSERKVLRHIEVKALWIDTDWYVRNVLAYIPRNAIDNGCNVNDYRWSGYGAMFRRTNNNKMGSKRVSLLTARDVKRIMHTGDKLDRVPWLIDDDGCLIPESFCDHTYLEQAFNNDQSFFLKTIGSLNVAEMRYNLEERPYIMVPDTDLYKSADELACLWFKKSLSELSIEQKNRLIPYIDHTRKTTAKQLGRVFGLPVEKIEGIVRAKE
ncbi:MAG: transposase [Bacteroidales bacterium]|nr:transposase [Bacteroidales bacterium]